MEEWDISVEEMYEYNPRYSLVKCDSCNERVSSRSVHILESFKEPDVSILICNRCYGKLLGDKK